jgi:hypothetical protein
VTTQIPLGGCALLRPARRLPAAERPGDDDGRRDLLRCVQFKDGNKWKFSDGDRMFFAEIHDDGFLERVDDGSEAFRKGDRLDVQMRIVQTDKLDGLHTEHHVMKVNRHIPRQVQLRMPERETASRSDASGVRPAPGSFHGAGGRMLPPHVEPPHVECIGRLVGRRLRAFGRRPTLLLLVPPLPQVPIELPTMSRVSPPSHLARAPCATSTSGWPRRSASPRTPGS